MSKRTPGPWVVYGNRIFPKGKSSNIATASIMNFELNHDGTQRPCKEMEANAKLIAAAPDLLAACKCAIEQIMNAGMEDFLDSYVIQELSEAIQKAEGGQK
jgi:hypothetical protein